MATMMMFWTTLEMGTLLPWQQMLHFSVTLSTTGSPVSLRRRLGTTSTCWSRPLPGNSRWVTSEEEEEWGRNWCGCAGRMSSLSPSLPPSPQEDVPVVRGLLHHYHWDQIETKRRYLTTLPLPPLSHQTYVHHITFKFTLPLKASKWRPCLHDSKSDNH